MVGVRASLALRTSLKIKNHQAFQWKLETELRCVRNQVDLLQEDLLPQQSLRKDKGWAFPKMTKRSTHLKPTDLIVPHDTILKLKKDKEV